MQKWFRRALAMVMAMLLAAAALMPSALADWKDDLRQAFGLTEDTSEADTRSAPQQSAPKTSKSKSNKQSKTSKASESPGADPWALPITEPQRIVNYLATFGKLPDNFITKKEAQALGWDSRSNYVGDVAPGKSIGGDRYGNYEGTLPDKKGRKWYECDTGYKGKKRGATRLLYSSDGLYYYTEDHYNTFTQMFPED